MTAYNKIIYYEAIKSELDRATLSIDRQIVKMRQVVEKISAVLLKLDCMPLESSQSSNETLCHFKIGEAIFYMASIVQRYDQIKKEVCSQNAQEVYSSFEEYKEASTRRVDYLKTAARRLSAVAENIANVFNEIVERDESDRRDSSGSDGSESL